MDSVDYVDTFIAIADDCSAPAGVEPPSKAGSPSVAARTYQLIAEHPYELTSGDVIFTVYADRAGIPTAERTAAREAFYARGQACLRASDLGKRYGWGIHADATGRVAVVGRETPEYDEFVGGRRLSDSGAPVTIKKAMRSARRG